MAAFATNPRLPSREFNDPVAIYLNKLCCPLISNLNRARELKLTSLANSPVPYEQQVYLMDIWMANHTDEAGFLAEQQCMCGSSLFEVWAGCSDCLFAHAWTLYTPKKKVSQSPR